jgi:hypothetical protein
MDRAIFRRIGGLEVIKFASTCLVIALAATILRASHLDGPAEFVFFLLIVVSPLFIGLSVSVSVWRLMSRVLPLGLGTPERALLALSSFVLVGSCGPLILCLTVMLITHDGGSLGAFGLGALLAILLSELLCTFAVGIFVERVILDRTRRGR